MNHDPRDCSTEDDGVDEDMMFEFEEELTARLSLHDGEGVAMATAASRARSPFADASALSSTQPPRPTNPVAAVLQSANDAEDAAFASLSTSPFCAGGLASSAASATLLDKSPSFDFNGRRKRKYFDDSCCVTPRVRPLAKRAKSFSCVGDILLPDCGFKSICSTGLTPTSIATEPSAPATATVAAMARDSFQTGQSLFMSSSSSSSSLPSSSRSKSIQIPHRERASAAHRSAALHLQRSSSGPARGSSAYAHVSKTLDVPAASSDPLTTQASSSWNASVEYFCRRSLDISSPLRNRFRDLVVGSVGRAGGLKSP